MKHLGAIASPVLLSGAVLWLPGCYGGAATTEHTGRDRSAFTINYHVPLHIFDVVSIASFTDSKTGANCFVAMSGTQSVSISCLPAVTPPGPEVSP